MGKSDHWIPCDVGICEAPRGSSGITNCIHCGKELHEIQGEWFTWDSYRYKNPQPQDYVDLDCIHLRNLGSSLIEVVVGLEKVYLEKQFVVSDWRSPGPQYIPPSKSKLEYVEMMTNPLIKGFIRLIKEVRKSEPCVQCEFLNKLLKDSICLSCLEERRYSPELPKGHTFDVSRWVSTFKKHVEADSKKS